MARVAKPLVWALPVWIAAFGCYPNPNDLRRGSSSGGGGQGSGGGGGVGSGGSPVSGAGGTTGVGGKIGVGGGAVPGTGGAPGFGGKPAGTGGIAPGSGGVAPGFGGKPAGTGGIAPGSGGGAPGSGGAAPGTGGYAGDGKALIPSAGGWIDATTNAFGIKGAWYAISDAFLIGTPPGGDCVALGKHTLAQCSMVTSPVPGDPFPPGAGGKMCTSGSTAQVILHPDTGQYDYGYLWGASIGFDFSGTGRSTPPFKYPFDAPAHGVRGVAFDIEYLVTPATGLRVVFPLQAADGSDSDVYAYWGATPNYPASPVVAGTNKVYWTAVTSPMGDVFDPTKLGAMHFGVPTTTTSRTPFSYCISNVRVLTGTIADGL